MTKYDVLKIICDEKRRLDDIKSKSDLVHWFWEVGFRNILINEKSRHITCIVSRPNRFISKFRKPIGNFLIHLSYRVFKKLGYSFELKKDTDDEYYSLLSDYIMENNMR